MKLPNSFLSIIKKENSLYLAYRYIGILKYNLNQNIFEFKNQGIICTFTRNLSKSKKGYIFV